MSKSLNVRLTNELSGALNIFAAKYDLDRSQAARLVLSRGLIDHEAYAPPALPNWQVEAWTSLLRGMFGDERLVLTDEVKAMLVKAIANLNARDAQVLRLRFGLDGPWHTQTEVAAVMGWEGGRSRAHQVERVALARGRGWCKGRGIWELLKDQLRENDEY